MDKKKIAYELDELERELRAMVLEGHFSEDATDCLLRMVAAGELNIAFETLVDNMSEYEERVFSPDFRGRLAKVRERLDGLPPGYV